MYYKKRRRPEYSQHFLRDRQLVKQLIGKSSIGKNDLVVEIGPGTGIITRELLRVAGNVMAVEIDPRMVQTLKQKCDDPKLVLFEADFLQFPLPQGEYKVFANLPFATEGEIVRKLLDGASQPIEAHMIVIKDVGERWAGHRRESMFSVLRKPWFEIKVTHRFGRSDFMPKPKIDTVMMSVWKRNKPLVEMRLTREYQKFVKQGFGGGRRVDTNLRRFCSKIELNRLGRRLGFSEKAKPSDLSVKQWINLFERLKTG